MTMIRTNEAEWQHATGLARQICARVFRDGGAPADALEAFGMAHDDMGQNWRGVVDLIAGELVKSRMPQAPGATEFRQAA